MGSGGSKPEETKKLKPCCACPETKKARDECIVTNGEAKCGYLIEAHKKCMRDNGFEIGLTMVQLGKDDLLHLQICQKDIIKTDAEVKKEIESLKSLTNRSTKEVAERNRDIKKKLASLEEQINALEKFSNKVRTRGERQELFDQVTEHRNEVERNKHSLRQALIWLRTVTDEQSRNYLFKRDMVDEKEVELRQRTRQIESLKKEAYKTTEGLSTLVSRMSDQVKLSEETTSTLIHSSSVLKGTEGEFDSMKEHITSGGKLISKYGRRECTDRILLTLALIVYVAVILYILRKRVFSILF